MDKYVLIGCFSISADFAMPEELGCGTYEEMESLLDDYLHGDFDEYSKFEIISKEEWDG